MGFGSWPRKERFEPGDCGGKEELVLLPAAAVVEVRLGDWFAEEEDAGGGPPERGEVGAKGSS